MTGAGVILIPLQYATGIVTYYQFILEETVQSGLMGCYIADNQGHISVMDKVIDRLERVTVPKLHDYNKKYGFLAFYNKGAFNAFRVASEEAIRIYKECKDKGEWKYKSKSSDGPLIGFKGRMSITPSPVYAKNPVTLTAKLASEIDNPAETEAIDLVWIVEGLEAGKEQQSALPWKKERDISFTTTFNKSGKYKVECVACKPGTYGLTEEELNLLINPSLSEDSPIMLVDKIQKDPSITCVGDQAKLTINYKAVKYSTIPSRDVDIVWTIDKEEVKRDRCFGLPQEKTAKATLEQVFPVKDKFYILCKIMEPAVKGGTPLHQKVSYLNVKSSIACVNFTDKIKKDVSPVYTNLITTFTTKFASISDRENETEPLDILWLVNGKEAGRETLTALAHMAEQEVNYYVTFHEPGTYKLECVICQPGTYQPLKTPKEYINFTKQINKDHAPAYINETITFSTKFANTLDRENETEPLDFVWLIDEEEVKRETLTAPAHMAEREITLTKLFNEPGKYKIVAMTVDPGDPVCKPIDTATYTVTVYPTMAAVEFDGSITKEPAKAYAPESLTFKIKFFNSIDLPAITEEMDFVWLIDEEEVKRETLAALANMEKKEIAFTHTFDDSGEYKIKCICEGYYFDEDHVIDQASYTAKVYPLMKSVEFKEGITRDPSKCFVNDPVTFTTKIAASIDRDVETEAMDVVWTVDEEEVKREAITAPAHMGEREVTMQKTFSGSDEYAVKCRCEGSYFGKLNVIDETSHTAKVYPLMESVEFKEGITRDPSKCFVNDEITFTTKLATGIDWAVETEAIDVVWTVDEEEVKREAITAPAHMGEREVTMQKTFSGSDEYAVKCRCEGTYLGKLNVIDETSHTAKVYPLMESVEFTESITRDPLPTYVNDPVTFTTKIAASIDRDVETEAMDVVWTVDEEEVKREAITAPAHCGVKEVTLERTFSESDQYAIKCRCEGTYFDKLNVIDETSHTAKVYPLMESVEFTNSITRAPSPSHVNEQITFKIKFAASIDRNVETETMDVVWTVDEEEVKRETLTAPAHMTEREVTMKKTFLIAQNYAVKCRCEGTYFEELHVIDQASYTITIHEA
jgi:plastocyanin